MRKALIALSGATLAVIVGGAAYLATLDGGPAAGTATGTPIDAPGVVNVAGADLGGPFTLTSHEGETLTAAQVIDGPTLVYFGYTWCPDVCPFDTQRMVEATMMLEQRGIAVTPVFITVDPARDDVEALSHFAEAYHPEMIALTGSEAAIAEAAKAYKVYYSRAEGGGGGGAGGADDEYLMNHTAFTYFMMPDGIAALFRHDTAPSAMADEIERVLRARGDMG